jgi:hypothetical protein
MKKIKVFFVAILTAFCCFALSACDLVWAGVYLTGGLIDWVLDEDKNAPSDEELRMSTEIIEGAKIVEITQNEDGFYVAKTTALVKSLGEKDSDRFSYRLSYYDEYGYLLDTLQLYEMYLGAGDTYKVEYDAVLYFEPATARIHSVELYETYDYANERKAKEVIEFADEGSMTCTLGEDGLYHATVTGQVKLLSEVDEYSIPYVYVYVAFYDANGYLRVRQWEKQVKGPAERTYTVECTSETEIVSFKVVCGTTMYSIIY